MDDAARIRDLYERKTRAFAAKPSHARATGACTARVADGGFACTTTFGPHHLAIDLPESEGGASGGPSPGQVMRSGLAACLAVGYRLWGIRLGVALDEISVEMTCELDVRGQLGVEGVAPGWQRVSWAVHVVSDAPEDEVRRVVETADRVSPMLASLDRDIVRQRTLTVARRGS